MTYLDANATQPLRPVARAAMLAAFDAVGNPSSVHAAGRAARRILEDARESITTCLGGGSERVVFTSGGTEANVAAIHALSIGRQVIVGATEHDAVRRACPEAAILSVNQDGLSRLDHLAELLREGGSALVCVMLANNETGVIAPIADIAALCRAAGAFLHVDAVQAAGRVPVDLARLGAHSLAVSSHKVGGPAGGGAWLMAEDFPVRPLIAGGGQERGWRGGTPPVAVLAGFAAALAEPFADLAPIRDRIDHAARASGATIVAGDAPRLPNTTCLVLPGVAAQSQVMVLDLAGIAVSAGAACSSGKVARSHVLDAMGLGDRAGEAIRVSLPWNATMADAAAFTAAYAEMADRLARRAA